VFLWSNRKNAQISHFVWSCSVIYQLGNKNAEIPPNFGSKSISALIGLSTFGVSQQFQANRQQTSNKHRQISHCACVRVCMYVVVQQLVEGKLEMRQNCGWGTI
jgi:hypothetical protein